MSIINAEKFEDMELGQFLELPDFDKRFIYGTDNARLKKIGCTLELVYLEGGKKLFSSEVFGFKVEGNIISAIYIDIKKMVMIRGAMLKTYRTFNDGRSQVFDTLNASYNLKKADIHDLRVEYKRSKPASKYFNVGCRQYKSEVAIYNLFKRYAISKNGNKFVHPVDFGDLEKGKEVMAILYHMLFNKIRRTYPLMDKGFIIGNKE